MSQSESKASGEASGERQSGSVLDILYCDTRRVGAFLSQFDELGVPTRVSVSESVQKARGRAFKFGAGGGIAGIGNASLNIERGPAAVGGSEAEARDYDPLWANAFALLDYLESNELVVRGLNRARIGQFVLAKGRLSVIDTGLMREAWHQPTIMRMVKAGAAQNPKPMKGLPQPVDVILDLLKVLPHSTHATVDGSEGNIWFSVAPEGLVTAPSDLLLKHGATIAGEWQMLGILDAQPEPAKGAGWASVEVAPVADVPADRIVAAVVEALAPIVRNLFGRPPGAYGATPLLIFREVETAA